MRRWLSDGWTYEDWDSISSASDRLNAIYHDLDRALGGGAGRMNPSEVIEVAQRLQAVVDSLRAATLDYL